MGMSPDEIKMQKIAEEAKINAEATVEVVAEPVVEPKAE